MQLGLANVQSVSKPHEVIIEQTKHSIALLQFFVETNFSFAFFFELRPGPFLEKYFGGGGG